MKPWKSLTDEEVEDIMNSMPGGLSGYLRLWGWRTFARAIEERLRLRNDPDSQLEAMREALEEAAFDLDDAGKREAARQCRALLQQLPSTGNS